MRWVLTMLLVLAGFSGHAGDGLTGTLRLRGSDSMDPLVRLWVDAFQKVHPAVQCDIESHGSGTAPAALMEGFADLGHMSRPMNAQETDAFLAKRGHTPTQFVVAFDALAIFVHRDNPIKRLTVAQVDAMYSTGRKAGWEEPLTHWGDLYLRRPLKTAEIHPWTRDERSGTRAFFQEKVLQKDGAMRLGIAVADQLGIIEAVAKDPAAIGYGPVTYATPQVRVVPLAGLLDGRASVPTPDTIRSGRYPLARALSLYVNQAPGTPLPPVVKAFLAFIYSPEGQALVRQYGSVPLDPEACSAELGRLS